MRRGRSGSWQTPPSRRSERLRLPSVRGWPGPRAEELAEGAVVRHDGGEVGIFLRAVLARTVHAEGDGGDAQLAVEAPVADAVLAQEITLVALAPGGLLEPEDLGVVTVGAVRLVEDVDHGRDPRLAEALQVAGDLGGGPA